jgi:hypothetical protein
VEAEKWDGKSEKVLGITLKITEYGDGYFFDDVFTEVYISTNDYLMKENGEYYPVNPDIFEETYEEITDYDENCKEDCEYLLPLLEFGKVLCCKYKVYIFNSDIKYKYKKCSECKNE